MDLDFFKNSLKYNASLTIIGVIILYLLKPIFENVDFISNNPMTTLLFFVIAINACLLVALYNNKNKKITKNNKSALQSGVSNNSISGNKARNINIKATEIINDNKIDNNEVEGDITIGQGFKNGK